MGKSEISRRHFLAASAAGAIVVGTKVYAQDATPVDAVHGSADAGATPVPAGPAVPPEFETPTNWPTENYDLKGTRNPQGSNISSETVGTLGDAWKFKVDIAAAFGALTAYPSIVDGVIYQQDAMSNVYAIDLETGEVIWTIEHNEAVPSGGPNGTAVAYGNVYYTVGGPGEVIAVNAASAEQLWVTNIQGQKKEGITIAPAVYDNVVYVSTIPGTADSFYSGGERGMIHALDAHTGEVIWYFDTTTDNLWGNARVNSGGGLWHPPSFDDAGMIYAGVGNAGPYPGTEEWPSGSSRPGDNDYANSILKIDPATGSLVWYNNITGRDIFDLDNQLTPILVTAEIGGAERNVAITSGKHGFVVVVDQETGEELWRTAVGEHNGNASLQELPEGESTTVLPGTLGGVETPMAYADGRVFAPVYNMASVYTPEGLDPSSIDFLGATGQLVCLDVTTGEILWDVALEKGTLAGATVVNDLVFIGGLDGVVRGLHVETGEQVFTYQASAGLNASFAVSGDYLLIPAGGPLGASSDTFAEIPDEGANLIALKLGGTVQEAGATASPDATPAEEAAAGGAADAVEVTAIDIAFEPKELSIPADTDVTFTISNEGMLQHDFAIEDTDYHSEMLNGGTSTEMVVNLPAGSYIYFCSVAGHREAGMQGTLTVG